MQKLSPRAFRPELVLCGTDYHKATRRHKSSIEAVRDVGAARAYLSPPLHTFHLEGIVHTFHLEGIVRARWGNGRWVADGGFRLVDSC